MAGDRNDPFAAFNFVVEFDGMPKAGFSECSGLSSESDVIEYRNGDEPATMRKLVGHIKYPKITCKRGCTKDKSLWNWRKETMDGKTKRKGGSIVLRDEAGQEALRWNFREAWLSKYDGPTLNAKGNEVAIETIEITHEGLTLA